MELNKRTPISEKVTHYAQLKNGSYLGHWDIEPDKDVKVVIESLAHEEVYNQQTNKKETKTVAAFRGAQKKLILNATNLKNISSWHGPNPQKWPGKEITLFRTTTKVAGKTEECIRVRPNSSRKDASDKAASAAE